MLKQMKETFESNLSNSGKEELEGQKAYEELKAAKEDEIATGQNNIETKTQELATTDEKLAQAKQDLVDTRASLSADEQFLMMLKETCQATDQQWEQRQKDRQLEIEAVSKALAGLTSDDAHALFSKTFNSASFVQKSSTGNSERRAQASKLLSDIAKKNQNPKLMQLSAMVRLDAFTKVKKAIDDMIAQLTKEKKDEIKLKDFCVEAFNENERNTERKEREKKDVEALIDDLTMTIDSLAQAIETLKGEISEMQTQMKRAGDDRDAENKEFQQVVADQRATVQLLNQALKVLSAVYDKKMMLTSLKGQGKASPPPPPGFVGGGKAKKNAAGGGVVGMLKGIIAEAQALEEEATKAEADGQKAYEDFVNKSDEKAKAEGDLVTATENKEEVMNQL